MITLKEFVEATAPNIFDTLQFNIYFPEKRESITLKPENKDFDSFIKKYGNKKIGYIGIFSRNTFALDLMEE